MHVLPPTPRRRAPVPYSSKADSYMEHSVHAGEAVAVVGMSCRFPQAGSVNDYWRMLIDNTDAVTPVPEDRFDAAAYHSPAPATPGKTVSKDGGFLKDAFSFDAGFFGVSPAEARTMDPQQRLLLHVTWEALEAAGIRPSSLAATRTGVFVGQATGEYAETAPQPDGPHIHHAAGCRIRAVAAGRISYALDLRGPSIVLDTACSSSLVAVHTARQSLLTGESDLAIASAANIILSPHDSIAYSQGGMLSAGGRCRFGDAGADGFVRSEGIATVVLKRLPDALRDGTPVLALLLGSAVTNDGKGSGLLLKPSVTGQADMLREACRSAGITPGQLDYVEAHGTGTRVGDAVELSALAEATADGRSPEHPLKTGSVKTNIGHAEAAAGLAGLIKAVLIARHGVVPASLHVDTPHPLLADGRLPVELVTSNQPLRKAGRQALLGVSSFGLSGTNAHVVIGEFTPEPEDDTAGGPAAHNSDDHLLTLTARSPTALRQLADAYADHLAPQGEGRSHRLADICATAATTRDAHPYRLWATGNSHDDLARTLRTLAAGQSTPEGAMTDAGFSAPRRICFVFPGQGSQWLGMGRTMLASSPAFSRTLRTCDRAIRSEVGWSVEELLTGPGAHFPDEVEKVQPALWAMQVALASAWRERGVEPDLCVGHSMGEVAAACVSGALTLKDAAAVVCRRSQLMKRVAGGGAMLVVELSPEQARQEISTRTHAVCVAAHNAPTRTVLAGDCGELSALSAELEARGVPSHAVNVNVASHSPHMDPLRDDLVEQLTALSPGRARTCMVSTVRCGAVLGPELDAHYWADNLRNTVRFADTIRKVAADGEYVFVEVSPHPVLTAAIGETLAEAGLPGAAVPTLRRQADEPAELTHSTGRLFAAGGRVSWEQWYRHRTRPVPLPSYTWDTAVFRPAPAGITPAQPPTFVHRIDLARLDVAAWAGQVRVHGVSPLPPAVSLMAILEAGRKASPGLTSSLKEVELGTELVDLTAPGDLTLCVTVEDTPGARRAQVEAERSGTGDRVLCATAVLGTTDTDGHDALEGSWTLDAALSRCAEHVSAAEFTELARGQGFEIGEAFAGVERLWRREGEAVARMRRPKAHPHAAWESCLQPMLATWASPRCPGIPGHAYAPIGFDDVRLAQDLPEHFWSMALLRNPAGTQQAVADVLVLGIDGRMIAEFRGVRLNRLREHRHPAARRLRAAAARLRSITSRLTGQTGRAAPAGPEPVLLPVEPTMPSPAPCAPAQQKTPSGNFTADELLHQAADILGMPPGGLDPRRALRDFGLDSLMATVLQRRLRTDCNIEVPLGQLLGTESLATISKSLTRGGAVPA
ncbi:type I polyketide synthase [Streptomyces sp. Ag109_O5-1]|uniref:type I polyketide synthase n=1 Tax=Streptomyces sp. Ag109_O5-1 TaxID=1938851 RepID=UPI000F50216C|nr:type I polyketide synthase [Streptomyces sp. Ag109_O5-1]